MKSETLVVKTSQALLYELVVQSEALGCGSQAGYRRQVETTHRQSKLVCQSLHTLDQNRTGIAWDLRMAKGDFLHQGPHLLTTPAAAVLHLFSLIVKKRNRTHIVLTFINHLP